MISFTIPGPPTGKGRPRMTRAGHAFTPAKTRRAEGFVQHLAAQAMDGRARLDGVALVMTVSIAVTPPASWSRRKIAEALAGAVRPTVRPDLDNAAKLIADACNGIVYRDDAQIVEMRLIKRYALEEATLVVVSVASANEEADVARAA